MSLNKKTSSIWSHFTVIDDTHFAKCDILNANTHLRQVSQI